MNIPLNINWQQILLHLLNFAILAGGLYFLLYGPVKKFMDERVRHYQDMEESAQKKVEEAEQLKGKYADRLNSAEQEIHELRTRTVKSLQEQTEQQLAEASKQAEAILTDAKHSAELGRDKMLRDAQKDLQEMAVTATEKLLLTSGGDPIDQFLIAAERGSTHGRKEE